MTIIRIINVLNAAEASKMVNRLILLRRKLKYRDQ